MCWARCENELPWPINRRKPVLCYVSVTKPPTIHELQIHRINEKRIIMLGTNPISYYLHRSIR